MEGNLIFYTLPDDHGLKKDDAVKSEVGFVTLKRDRPGKGIERIEIKLLNP